MALPFHKLLAALGGGLGAQAAAILASYGTDAHIYLPGIGALNGYTLGNWLDSGGTTPATVDNPVGLVQDAIGTIHVSQGTTANKPILRKPSNNYYWEFDGVNDSLASASAPFQMADDHCVILGVSRAAVTAEKHPVGVGSSGSTTPIAAFIVHWGSGYISVYWRDDASTLYIAQSGATYSAGQVRVVSARKSGNNKVCRVDGVGGSVNSTPVGATSAFDKLMIGATHTGSFGGNIYPVIAIKGDISDANLLILERWVGSLSGVTI
jgi:hypothetical protein